MADSSKHNIVIIGGGIIGCSTAYFLTRHPAYDPSKHSITLLEASSIAGGASGKAGGLLALWAYPSNLVSLSYNLHASLAKEHNGAQRWGYRRIHCGQLDAKGRHLPEARAPANGKPNGAGADPSGVSLHKRDDAAFSQLRRAGFPKDLDWIAPESAKAYDKMGDPDTTAQVHPFQFTTSMAQLAEEKGVKILTDAHVDAIEEADGAVKSVSYTTQGRKETIPCRHAVLAAGPWTQRLNADAPIGGLRAHSVVIRPSREVSGYALFTEIKLPAGFGGKGKSGWGAQVVSPEIYARPFGEVYACGEGDSLVPLPATTRDVEVDDARCQDIVDYVASVSDELRDGEVAARQACYLPVVRGAGAGGPFIGEMKGSKGLVLASGHSCWGIQNGPGTGKLVSEVVFDGAAKSAKLGQLDPAKAL